MYAVIETGGKQYRVEVGTELEVELLDVEPGKTITIDRVLLVADGDESTIGRPLVADASVSAEVVNQTRGPKLISFKYRPKARSRVKKGHRQELTILRIADITFGGKSAAKDAKQAEDKARTERMRLEEAAAAQAAKDAELAAKLARPTSRSRPNRRRRPSRRRRRRRRPRQSRRPTPRPSPRPRRTPRPRPRAAAPKKTTAKADTDATTAKAAPKKPRATKKDE